MQDRHSTARDLAAEKEDRALFRTYGGPIAIDLVPQINKSNPAEILVQGFFNGQKEVFLVFSGRRAQQFGPLEARLKWADTRARQAAAAAQRPPPSVDQIKLPVHIKGSWRQQFRRQQDGSEQGCHQLVAARWAFADRNGELVQFGESPAFDMTRTNRRKSYILTAREFDAPPQQSRQVDQGRSDG